MADANSSSNASASASEAKDDMDLEDAVSVVDNPDNGGNLRCCPAHLVHDSKDKPTADIPKLVHLKKAESSLGRDRNTVDVVLDSVKFPRMISRIHAHISHLSNGIWKIRDNRSVNGLFVNDIKVQEAELGDGDVIVFGGGGSCQFGQRKSQTQSEFIYKFQINPAENGQTNRKKRARPEPEEPLDDEYGLPVSAVKRIKLAAEESLAKTWQDAVGQKEKELVAIKETLKQEADEELRKQLQALEETKAKEVQETIQRKESELHEKEKQMVEEFKEKETLIQRKMSEQEESLQKQKEDLQKQEEELKQKEQLFHMQFENLKKEVVEKAEEAESSKKMVSQLQTQLKATGDAAVLKNAVYEEVTCAICQDIMHDPRTLECAHSFCNACLNQWQRQKRECPTCRKKIVATPRKTLTLDSIIQKMIPFLSPEDRRSWESKLNEREEQQQLEALTQMIQVANAKNLRFLDITRPWLDSEKATFKDGVDRYIGKARGLYCQTTGLTENWISSANANALTLAVTNLGIRQNQHQHPHQDFSTPSLRAALRAFIEKKQPSVKEVIQL